MDNCTKSSISRVSFLKSLSFGYRFVCIVMLSANMSPGVVFVLPVIMLNGFYTTKHKVVNYVNIITQPLLYFVF